MNPNTYKIPTRHFCALPWWSNHLKKTPLATRIPVWELRAVQWPGLALNRARAGGWETGFLTTVVAVIPPQEEWKEREAAPSTRTDRALQSDTRRLEIQLVFLTCKMGGEENITSLLLKLDERVHRAPNTGSRRCSGRPVPFLPSLVQSPQQQKCCLLEKKPLTPRFRRLRAQAPGPDCLCPHCVSATSWRVALDKLLNVSVPQLPICKMRVPIIAPTS